MLTVSKKIDLQNKLLKQREAQQQQAILIPKIKPDKKNKVKTTTINEKQKSENELKIREFFEKVNDLTDENLNDKKKDIIKKGIELFKNTSDDSWKKLESFNKLMYIMKAFALNKNINFIIQNILNNDIYLYIKTSEELHEFITSYLQSEKTFDKYFNYWSEENKNKQDKLIQKEFNVERERKRKRDEEEDNDEEKVETVFSPKEKKYKRYILDNSKNQPRDLTPAEMKNVLVTLDIDVIYDLANKKGIKNVEKRGKHSLIDNIIRKEFPQKIVEKIKYVDEEKSKKFKEIDFKEDYLNTLSLDQLKSLDLGPYRISQNFEDKAELVDYILKTVKIYKLIKLIDIDSASKYSVEDLIEKYDNLSLEELDELLDKIYTDGKEAPYTKSQDILIKDILNDMVSEETVKLMSETLSKEFLKIAPMISDYGTRLEYNTVYINSLINELKNDTHLNREFFKRVANVIVYLKIPQAKLFQNNIKKEYYLPEILAHLSDYEKLPEIFEDPIVPNEMIEKTSKTISDNIDRLVEQFAENVYLRRNLYKSKSYFPLEYINYNIKTRNRLSACENKNRVEGVKEDEIVYYKDDIDNKIYCFSLNELLKQFLDNNITNPETQRDFNTPFVIRFLELYNNKLHESGFTVKEKIQIQEEKKYRPDIIPDLWSVIGLNIKELEDELTNEKIEIKEDKEGEEEREEKRDKDVVDGIRESVDIAEKNACEYCKTHLTDDSLKTIVHHNEESKIIQFCSIKCFEDKNDGWEKYKKKVQRKKEKTEEKIILKPRLEALEKIKNIDKILTKEEITKILKKQYNNNIISFLSRQPFKIDNDPKKFTIKNLSAKKELKELRKYAKEKNILLPKGLNKKELVKYIFKHTVDKKDRSEKVKKELRYILKNNKKTIQDMADFIFTELYKNSDKTPEYINDEKEKWIVKWIENNKN